MDDAATGNCRSKPRAHNELTAAIAYLKQGAELALVLSKVHTRLARCVLRVRVLVGRRMTIEARSEHHAQNTEGRPIRSALRTSSLLNTRTADVMTVG